MLKSLDFRCSTETIACPQIIPLYLWYLRTIRQCILFGKNERNQVASNLKAPVKVRT